MQNKFKVWEIFGFVFVVIAGTLLHFAYEWSGGSRIVAAFAATDESVWQHVKLFIVPYFIWSAAGYFKFGREYGRYLTGRLAGLLAGMLFIIAFYYTYTGALGINVGWVNIASFAAAAAVAAACGYREAARKKPAQMAVNIISAALILAVVAAAVWWTYAPPSLPLFISPV